MARRRVSTVQRIKARTLGPMLSAFALLTQLGVVVPAYGRDGVVPHDADTVQAEREHVGTVAQHMASLLLFVAGGRIVSAEGPYEYLRPTWTLPDGVTFNSWTGLTEGDVFDTADQESRAWWIANAATVVTVSASGGDYTLAQLQTALNDAATANDIRAVVVDSAAAITATITLPNKTGTPNWTLVCCSDWWDGTWTPTGERYVDVDTELSHLFRIEAPSTSASAIQARAANASRYAFVGVHARRTMASSANVSTAIVNVTSTEDWVDTVEELPDEHLFAWSWIDGVWKDGETYYQTRRGLTANGYKLAFRNSISTGFGGTGGDTQALFIDRGAGRLTASNVLLEASSENWMSGGGTPNANFHPDDILFRRVHLTKRQDWNPASSLYPGFSPVTKNLWEVKHGRRILLEAFVARNSFAQAQTGAGLLVKSAKQSDNEISNTRPQWSRDITVRVGRVDDVGTPLVFSVYEFGVATPSEAALLVCEPLHRVDVCAVLGVSGVQSELNGATSAAVSISRGGAYEPKVNDPVGSFRVRWSTFASKDTGFRTRLMLLNAYSDMEPSSIEDCVFDYTPSFGLVRDGLITTGDSFGLTQMGITMRRCALPEAPSNLRRATGGWEAGHPDQFAPEGLWSLSAANPRSEPTNWFANRATGDWAPHPSATYRGLAADGRDPGAPLALIASATNGLVNTPSFIVEDFV